MKEKEVINALENICNSMHAIDCAIGNVIADALSSKQLSLVESKPDEIFLGEPIGMRYRFKDDETGIGIDIVVKTSNMG